MLEATETNTCIETVCRVLGRKKACDISDAECLAKRAGQTWGLEEQPACDSQTKNMIKICYWLWYMSSIVFGIAVKTSKVLKSSL